MNEFISVKMRTPYRLLTPNLDSSFLLSTSLSELFSLLSKNIILPKDRKIPVVIVNTFTTRHLPDKDKEKKKSQHHFFSFSNYISVVEKLLYHTKIVRMAMSNIWLGVGFFSFLMRFSILVARSSLCSTKRVQGGRNGWEHS